MHFLALLCQAATAKTPNHDPDDFQIAGCGERVPLGKAIGTTSSVCCMPPCSLPSAKDLCASVLVELSSNKFVAVAGAYPHAKFVPVPASSRTAMPTYAALR